MLSDDSSSDSETGRFKDRSSKPEELKGKSKNRDDNSRPARRERPFENDRYNRDFNRRRDDRDLLDRRSKERSRYSRSQRSPRRRHSRSPNRRKSIERRHDTTRRHDRDKRERSRPKVQTRSNSAERQRQQRSRTDRSPIQINISRSVTKDKVTSDEKTSNKFDRKTREKSTSSSPEHKAKRSEVRKPAPEEVRKIKSLSPVVVEDHVASDISDEVQLGSYYNMVPAVVKEKSEEESSEIDSSDDERLRAKLLNLEKELHKTRKKKHKKKHKRKTSKTREKNQDVTSVEVTSTTDIKEDKLKSPTTVIEAAEVSSTQKSNQKDSSEEGEISSDDDSQKEGIDPTDLRHKLKRSGPKVQSLDETDVCGPALPPHFEKRYKKECPPPNIEGPALPPQLKKKERNLGPSIPEEMRKALSKSDEGVKYISSDDDGIGPLPEGNEDKWSKAHKSLEERALEIKIKKLDGDNKHGPEVKSREQWMLELPEGKAKILGLEARSFRAKAGPDMSDRSSWTDTPEEKARKAAGVVDKEDPDVSLQREARERHITNRDEDQEKAVKKHKKKHKREESLLDLHQKKLKKKKKKEDKEEGKKERRPFSRDVDLQVDKFDEAQKKSIIKKAQELNTRFSRGEAKYL